MTAPAAKAQRVAEAAAWKIRLNEAGIDSSYEFEMWLLADPANEAAWRSVEEPWSLFGDHASSPTVVAARRDALSRAHDRIEQRSPRWLALAASIALILFASLGLLGYRWWDNRPDVYRTQHGERRVILLADGSRLSLDAETEVRVALGDDARKLELVAGQARFDVTHDSRRPFSVKAGKQTVVAIGTAFNIDLISARPEITLIEGKVEVYTAPAIHAKAPPPVTTLVAGQQLRFTTQAALVVPANVEAATAWTQGQLVFDDEPLANVVPRIVRYANHPITVSPDAASLRLSGVFQSDDVDGFLQTITDFLPVRTERSADGSVTIARAR